MCEKEDISKRANGFATDRRKWAIMKQNVVLLIIVFFLATPVVAQVQHTKDTLLIAISSDFEPFTFLNAEGKPAGMFVDMWRLWAEKTGKKVEFIASTWEISLENLRTGKADIHSGFLYSPEHLKWINSSQPLYEAGVTLFYPLRQDKTFDIKELSGQTLAVIHGSQLEQFLINTYPGIRVLTCDTREELVKVSREGKTKGFIATAHVGASAIDRLGFSGEFETLDGMLYREKFQAGVLKNNKELLSLIDKGFNAITYEEKSKIEARWIPDPATRYYTSSLGIHLTPEEESWLRKHPSIKVGMSPVIPPLKFAEKGVVKGIEPDYLNLLSEYTGIRFEYVIEDFSAMDAKVKSGDIDMFISFYIPERLAYMTFTEPMMDFKQVIITRADGPFISGIGALKGKKVATIKGVKLYEKLLSPYPDIEVIQVAGSDETFKAVAESKADALIARTYTAGYVMQHYPTLKIAGIAEFPPDPYRYAVRKDYPELVAILNKAIAAIPRDQHDAIVQKWFNVRIEYRPNWTQVLQWILVVGGVFTVLLAFTVFWNRRLRREIERRKKAEEQNRLYTEELSRSNIDLQQFAYVASHDLQEPLRMISSYLQLLERRYKDKLDDDASTFIGYAVDGATRLQNLIAGLLEFSRVKTHGCDFAPVAIRAVVERVCQDLQPLIRESGAEVRFGEMPVIQGDELQIARLFQNLLHNAIKFRRQGVPSVIDIHAEKTAADWVFSISDNGIGIEDQYFQRIFTIFQRLHRREDYPGTGIGLAICRRIVERHGGRIWLESNPGAGTSFYFSIPGKIF